MPSEKGPCHTVGFASVIEGTANQVDWSAVVVVDLVWETKLLQGDIGVGENTSLTKREC
jgi:hypothetical protein